MTPQDLGTTNMWLAIVAITGIVELLAGAAALYVGFLLYRKVVAAVDAGERRVTAAIASLQNQVTPVVERATALVDDARDVVARVKRAEESVRNVVQGVGEGVALVGGRLWPVVGLARGLVAAARALRGRGRERREREAARPARGGVGRS